MVPAEQLVRRTHRRVLEIVKAVVCEDEPASLPGLHSASWQEEQTGSHTMAAVTDWLPTSRKKRTAGAAACALLHPQIGCLYLAGFS